MKLRTEFNHRDELIAYLRETFPDAAARSPNVSDTRGLVLPLYLERSLSERLTGAACYVSSL